MSYYFAGLELIVNGTSYSTDDDAKVNSGDEVQITGQLYNDKGLPAQDTQIKFIPIGCGLKTITTTTDENGYFTINFQAPDWSTCVLCDKKIQLGTIYGIVPDAVTEWGSGIVAEWQIYCYATCKKKSTGAKVIAISCGLGQSYTPTLDQPFVIDLTIKNEGGSPGKGFFSFYIDGKFVQRSELPYDYELNPGEEKTIKVDLPPPKTSGNIEVKVVSEDGSSITCNKIKVEKPPYPVAKIVKAGIKQGSNLLPTGIYNLSNCTIYAEIKNVGSNGYIWASILENWSTDIEDYKKYLTSNETLVIEKQISVNDKTLVVIEAGHYSNEQKIKDCEEGWLLIPKSKPSNPTQPSQPSQPSTPSKPSQPSTPTSPSVPTTPSQPSQEILDEIKSCYNNSVQTKPTLKITNWNILVDNNQITSPGYYKFDIGSKVTINCTIKNISNESGYGKIKIICNGIEMQENIESNNFTYLHPGNEISSTVTLILSKTLHIRIEAVRCNGTFEEVCDSIDNIVISPHISIHGIIDLIKRLVGDII